MLCDSFNDELQRLSTGDMLMEYLIMSGLTAVIIGLLYAVVKQKQQETLEWEKRKARKAQAKKVK
tara:strand:+ start:363 stop:557 length:195 start_codon:yes stop_codon:yes gene_type:complete